jgi:subtilisin-like proprotein convertase family protein
MFTVAMLLLMTASAMAATTIPLGGDSSRMTLVDEGKAGLTYRIEVGALQALEVSTKRGDFTQLFIPGFHSTMTEGAPELPQMNRLIAVPYGADAIVRVRDVETRTVRLADFGLEHPVFPHQPSVSKSADVDALPFVYDAAAYGVAKVEPTLASAEYLGRLRAMDIARLEVAPVRYLPRSGELEVVTALEVDVTFAGGDWAKTESLIESTYSPFFQAAYHKVDGIREFTGKSDLVKYPTKLVIITPPEFEAQLQGYVDWKTEKGFETIVGVIGSPEVGSTTSSIQSYLHGLYNAGTPEDPAPSFVVFVGDVAQCPTWMISGDATDRPYCAVDGDLFPEMYYGRLSATNSSQLQAIIDKTLLYDTYSMPDPSYLDRHTLIAGMDSGFGGSHGNGTIRYGEDYYWNATHDLDVSTYYYPESGGQASAIIADCSAGLSYINYTAHGSQTSWGNPYMGQSDINGMTNDGMYFLAVGNCCLTSTYDYGECFGETFLRAPNRGAIGYIGGSNSTYWDEDVWWAVGSIPSSQIRDGMTYEETGLGVYDALFHDMPGVTEDDWYVTNGAVVFCGNLAVSEAGSGLETYYWNIYNLLGDPSIAMYMGEPEPNPANFPATVFVGEPMMTIEAGWGTYVGLTQGGEIVGTGYVGESGVVDIEFNQVLTPGVPLKLVATSQDWAPVFAELNVIVPAVVTIDPVAIDANVQTDITVTVMEEDGVTPKPGIDVWAEGLQYQTTPVATDASGVAVISVDYPYGPTLDIVGQDPNETYRLFTEQVQVNAQPLSGDLTVATDIGLVDAFPLNLPGYLSTDVGAPYTLFAQLPDGTIVTGGDPLTVTATELGQVTGIVARDGHDLVTEAFDVIEAYGTVSGTVTSGGSALANVNVRLLDDQQDEVFSVFTDASGNYAGPEEVLVDDYTIVVDHFGYLHYEQAVFVNYGANTFDVDLTAAPSGVLTGHVYETDTMIPLQATVKVYRTDNGELYDEVTCDEQGFYETGALPYFDYEVKVRAWHHVPVTALVTIDSPSLVKDWVLDPTNGDLLLIDDTAGEPAAAKVDEKGNVIAPAYASAGAKSVTELTADLEELGYYVSVESIDTVDPSTFWDYDMVMLACGENISTLGNAAVRNGLVQFAQEGGHILLEGGELGYDQANSGDFATYVMHSNDWNHDSSGDISVPASSHYVATHPNDLTDTTIGITYDGYGDSDAMAPLSDAEAVGVWTEYTSDASVIAYDPNPAPEGGQIVFFCFNYAAAGEGRMDLLENAVLWLLTPEMGNSAVEGQVLLAGEDDHSGITVRATPNGGTTTTDASGNYSLDGLYAGTYQIIATKDGWSVGAQTVTLEDGQTLTGVDMVLTPVTVSEFCDQPNAPITDNNTTVVTMDVDAPVGSVISQVEVYLDITHTYIGDLDISVTTPCGSTVMLHNRSGGSTDDIVGWYPGDYAPAEDLGILMGLGMAGEWTLTVSDNAGGDQGTINEWCLRITHDSPVAIEDDGLPGEGDTPSAFAAYDNFPNPFNPMTTIRFDLPRRGQVSLRIYDVAGRLVRTLVDGEMPAAQHSVVWDGNDQTGRRQASGVYYYRLVTDERMATKKMMLVK